jgi:hypothetical protein
MADRWQRDVHDRDVEEVEELHQQEEPERQSAAAGLEGGGDLGAHSINLSS